MTRGVPRVVSQAHLSRLAGVSEAAIAQAIKGPLAAAKVARGRVNLDHPSVRAYLARHGVKAVPERVIAEPPARKQTGPPTNGGKKSVRVVTHVVDDVAGLADLTLREINRLFGSKQGFKDYLVQLKQIEDIREKRLRNELTEGKVILREPVEAFVFGAIDAANRRLLNDAPQTIARRLYALARGTATVEEAESEVRELISSHLRPVKAQCSKILRDAKAPAPPKTAAAVGEADQAQG
jgi:hypothetical protein